MIEQVTLRDLGVIAQATLPIGPGFTAVTGETGAGKTMVVTGLGLLLGARADAAAVRAGATQLAVDGIWTVPDSGPVADRVREAGGELEPLEDGTSELYLGRTVTAEGRSRASVGGRSAPVGVLAELADHLVVVHGQAEQLRLRSATAQREALDRFAGQPVAEALVAYRDAYEHTRGLQRELDELTTRREERAAEAERLRTLIDELDRVDPQPGEDVALAVRAERLANVEKLRMAAATAHQALSSEDDQPDVTELLATARRTLERAGADDPLLQERADDLADLGYRIADVSAQLSAYLADLDDAGPHELAAVEDRRAALSGLLRTHGTLEEALAQRESIPLRLTELDDDGDRIDRLTAELARAASVLDDAAERLTAARSRAARRLAAAVTGELQALAMPDARVEVTVSPAPGTAAGRDEVALLLAAHLGATLRPVTKAASGGELSRIMLAIEVVIAATDPVPTFVFDEVDAGIGGAAAIEVGRRLAALARTSQVIAVTHLAQVAAFATNHLSVVKSHDGSVTASSVCRLDGPEREAEMARLLSGMPDSPAALEHARELIALSTGTD